MPDLSHVTAASLDDYRTYQYGQLLAEYRGLIWAGLDLHHFLEASRVKWGLTPDSARAAYIEAQET